jgi:hypothetical protein
VLSGLDSADTHHTANSFALDPGGALYFQEGTFHHTQVETPYGPPVRNKNAGVYRYEPRTQKFEVYINFGFANPHGHVFDRWGQDIVVDGTGSNPYHAALFSGHLDYPAKHPHVKKEMGQAFVDWVISREGQKTIADFKIGGLTWTLAARYTLGLQDPRPRFRRQESRLQLPGGRELVSG